MSPTSRCYTFAATALRVPRVSICSYCGEPETKCPYCRHVHCDEDSCRPPDCARAEERELEQR